MKPFRIHAVLFDFDGTLTQPGAIDFDVICREIGCPADTPVLEYIESLADPQKKASAWQVVERFEMAAAAVSQPNRGAEKIIAHIRDSGLRLGILSRNSLASIRRALNNFTKIQENDFDYVVSRDLPVKPKPHPEGIYHAARAMGVDADQIMVVGDYIFDIQAGRAAGAVTVFLENGNGTAGASVAGDFSIAHLDDLKDILRMGLPLPTGKLPNDLLARFTGDFRLDDPSIIMGPGVGEDVAAIRPVDNEILVLKSDPITFATSAIDQYAILINANDIATSGAAPRWLLTTLLFPCGTTPSEIGHVMGAIREMGAGLGISLCGGHTEITDAVTRPVVSGMMIGTVPEVDLVDKRRVRSGDQVLLTKKVAVEGTAIIAREFGDRLLNLGMDQADLDDAKGFLSQIGILTEARIATDTGGIHAMHDVTEGGIATAIYELSAAGGRRIEVNMDAIPIYENTRRICSLFGLDPLGLIGSGSLLICCSPDSCRRLMGRIDKAGIPVSCVGCVTDSGVGVDALANGKKVPWPVFDRDELARLFDA
ncbi:MAG: HAD-IA family hydrolase [Deltaproteobacteria bacterium]|nr:HAD-IA family hydrolase [Deltaproteobacteria bacterium]